MLHLLCIQLHVIGNAWPSRLDKARESFRPALLFLRYTNLLSGLL